MKNQRLTPEEATASIQPLLKFIPEANALPIRTVGDPILRRTAQKVGIGNYFLSTSPRYYRDHILRIIADMVITLKAPPGGIGLAAPQVGHSLRIFIMRKKLSKLQPGVPEMRWTVCMNPEIIRISEGEEEDWESCLSVPGYYAPIARPREIKVRYCDIMGYTITTTLSGFFARMFLHELGHLDGRLFTDDIDPKRLMSEKEWRNRVLNAKKKG